MKKFNPEKELKKVQFKSSSNVNSTKLSNLYIPSLVIACSCLAMAGITFSAKLVDDSKDIYSINVEIINGNETSYVQKVKRGPFSDTITSVNSFGSLECTSGNLNYDEESGTISSPYVTENTRCVLVFRPDVVKNIEYDGLNMISDNLGTSYYYKASATDNYVKIKDMLFRIVRINGDGTYRLILNDIIMSSNYGVRNDYYMSDIKVNLEKWFSSNFNGEEYLVEGDYDVTNYSGYDLDNIINFEGYALGYVGMLSVREAELMTKDENGISFFDSVNGIYLSNPNGVTNVYAYKNGEIISVDSNTILNVRPVINVKGTLEGEGTLNNPYTIK